MAQPDEVVRWLIDHRETMTYQAMADALGMKRHEVRYALREAGYARPKPAELSEEQTAAIVRMYSHFTDEEIAVRLGLSTKQVSNRIVTLRKRGVLTGKRVPDYQGVDLWPDIPWHLRITDRGHNQYIPIKDGGR